MFAYDKALAIAEDVVKQLTPFSVRIEIAGSIRRKKDIVGDIEVVVIPKTVIQATLFELPTISAPVKGFIDVVNQWQKVKGSAYGKYTQRLLPEGIKLDVFTATKRNYGLQLSIRTGSAKFSHETLAWGWTNQGYHARNGLLYKDGIEYTFPEEQDLFTFLKIPWVAPENRL